MNKKLFLYLAIFSLALFIFYTPINGFLIKNFQNKNVFHVERVIDGDTAIIGNHSVRFLGINAPETTSKEFYSQEAKNFLKKEIGKKNVTLVFTNERTDKYGRWLAYVFLDGENINVKMVENGYAYYYLYNGKDSFSQDLKNAWNDCFDKKINLCYPSEESCGKCVKIESSGKIVNNCPNSCDVYNWMIKGEGRGEFHFNETADKNFGSGRELNFYIDLANSGKSLYLRDDKGHLVDWGIF